MRFRTVAAALMLSLLTASASRSTSEEEAIRLREAALADGSAYDFVRELTTRFGARPAGSVAEKNAAAWCAQQMKAIGLTDVRIESFPLAAWSRGSERGEIVGEGAQPLVVTALGGTTGTPEEGVEGEVAIFRTLEELQAAPANSLTGKIAMLTYRMPRLESGEGYNIATRGRGEGPGAAAKAGAVAYVLRSAGTSTHRFAHTGSTRFHEGRVPIPSFAVAQADADQIERLAAKGPVRLRLFSSARLVAGGTSQNVIGEIAGERDDEIIIIGAHLDSWDLGTGAVDDGAGVGIVLAAAKQIAAMPSRPRRTIRVVLFGAEEVGQPREPFWIIGGSHYARMHEDELPRSVIASEADLGAGRSMALALPPHWSTSPLAAAAARVLLPLGILIDGQPAPHGGADMFPMQSQGVPVFLFRQDASRYFDLHHTADDTLDKIDPTELRQVVAGWSAFLWLVAEDDGDYRAPPPK